jgi:transcriptional regulator with XRE-family HTH domain
MKPLHSPSAAEFRKKRKKSGMRQVDLAELLGLHVNSIKNFESGKTKCSPQIYGFMCYWLEERRQEIAGRLEEHCRRWKSRAYRNEWKRKARERYGE